MVNTWQRTRSRWKKRRPFAATSVFFGLAAALAYIVTRLRGDTRASEIFFVLIISCSLLILRAEYLPALNHDVPQRWRSKHLLAIAHLAAALLGIAVGLAALLGFIPAMPLVVTITVVALTIITNVLGLIQWIDGSYTPRQPINQREQ